jgi:hypothetical protein
MFGAAMSVICSLHVISYYYYLTLNTLNKYEIILFKDKLTCYFLTFCQIWHIIQPYQRVISA